MLEEPVPKRKALLGPVDKQKENEGKKVRKKRQRRPPKTKDMQFGRRFERRSLISARIQLHVAMGYDDG
jgi:hypothetical protein